MYELPFHLNNISEQILMILFASTFTNYVLSLFVQQVTVDQALPNSY